MASTPVTQPTDADVAAYLDTVTPEVRRTDAHRLAALMEQVTGQPPVLWGTSIVGFGSVTYAYTSGRTGDWPPVGFAPRKSALTLYLMDGLEAHEADLAELGPHTTGASCLYVKRLDAVDTTVLERMIATSWADRGANPRA